MLLLGAAIIALIWANSSAGASYEGLWEAEISMRVGPWNLAPTPRLVVNDALMTIFFFVVGLEIKREFAVGELGDKKTAALSYFGAVGGMVIPALLYLLLNLGGEGARGWGIPMATDIAFAVGVLAIVGRGLPGGLKLFLLSLAIVDDIGAIIVIALFYSDGIWVPALGAAATLLLVVGGLKKARVTAIPVYVALGAGVWLAVFLSGIHPTIAGVVLGLLTPALPSHRSQGTQDMAGETVCPLTRLERALHPWTSFVIVPLFALANAGVTFGGDALRRSLSSPVTMGIIVGLVLGKIVGITLGAWLGTRSGLARLPAGASWPKLAGVAAVAGVGFTVSLFIADLAFDQPETLESAKVGILAASVLAGIIGACLLMATRRSDTATRRPG